jgi:hypothetical protein
MPTEQTVFDVSHNEAFRRLGSLEPGQQWSAFDVPREQARDGKATQFVTTIWNFHSNRDEKGRRTATEHAIAKDQVDGTYWYRVRKPYAGTTRKTWVAHWNGLLLALEKGIPIVGVLKDVHTDRCSLTHLFDCGNPRYQVDGSAMWLQLRPRGEVGCPVRPIDIRQITHADRRPDTFSERTRRFEESVHEALEGGATERRVRLANASRLPTRVEITTSVFDRNPDVVAEVLLRAEGVCEGCSQPAPFVRRSDGTPYLEVHHRIPLADGGEDVPENAVALCPNCHRAAHYA